MKPSKLKKHIKVVAILLALLIMFGIVGTMDRETAEADQAFREEMMMQAHREGRGVGPDYRGMLHRGEGLRKPPAR